MIKFSPSDGESLNVDELTLSYINPRMDLETYEFCLSLKCGNFSATNSSGSTTCSSEKEEKYSFYSKSINAKW